MAARCWWMRSAAALVCGNASTRRPRWTLANAPVRDFRPWPTWPSCSSLLPVAGYPSLMPSAWGRTACSCTCSAWLKARIRPRWANGCGAQTKESVMDLHRLNAQFVDWASQQDKPGRWLHAGEAEVFFDDTEIEVEGHKFEGARINYEGHRALSWQTLWYGPWLLDGILDGAGDVSAHLGVLLDEHQ